MILHNQIGVACYNNMQSAQIKSKNRWDRTNNLVEQPVNEANLRRKIEEIDHKNKKLISIADSIMKTSFIRPTQPIPTIITELEQDMKNSFNSLLQNIREYFISIDDKLRIVGHFINNSLQKPTQEQNQHTKYDQLLVRIDSLERNLKKTQQNENKLMGVIEEMIGGKRTQDQPTILKYANEQQSYSSNQYDFNRQSQKDRETSSFRLFSLKGQNTKKTSNFNLIESEVSEGINFGKREGIYVHKDRKEQKVRKPIDCLWREREVQKEAGRRSTGQLELEDSNRMHRLSFMMKALKE